MAVAKAESRSLILVTALYACRSITASPVQASYEGPLRALYEGLSGAVWLRNDGWLDGRPCNGTVNRWWGLICANDEVQQVLLTYNDVSGTLAPELASLRSLTQIWMQHSPNLAGTFPASWTQIANLTDVVLNDNALSGTVPTELGQLPNLDSLVLDTNAISGTVPSELGQLTGLLYLGLDSNSLSGSLPSSLGGVTSLEWLNLDTNALSGSIAEQLSQLSSLIWLDLYKNRLSGTLPSWLGHLPLSQNLRVHGNLLSGTVPTEIAALDAPYCYLSNAQCLSDDAGEICADGVTNQFRCPLPPTLAKSPCGGRGLNCSTVRASHTQSHA